jgi:hypothetical protein
LIDSPTADELVDPQVIGLMAIDSGEAQRRLKAWFSDGMFAPDDLSTRAHGLDLRPAYYPFWTFDGTLEAHWACEIREGSGDNARWVPESGEELFFFDDVVVPGVRRISVKAISRIEPFQLKELVAFEPGHLAGWPALNYDRSLADASLLAREIVMKRVRRDIHRRVITGEDRRGLQVTGGDWSGLTFKYVLLPLWVGSYRYRGGMYPVLINGQTGAVGGEKPRDRVKVVMVWTLVAMAVFVVSLLIALVLSLYGDAILETLMLFLDS